MNKKKKFVLIILGLFLVLFISWYAYLVLTPPAGGGGGVFNPETGKFHTFR